MHSWRTFGLIAALIICVQALMLTIFGQPLLATSGHLLLWVSDPLSPDTSQNIADWYTFSHLVHGFLFYWVLGLLFPRLPIAARLALAVGIESTWEITENTPWLIEHYRQQALAVGYFGDSILNSLCDTVAMMLGFLAARKLPVWASIVAVLGLEAVPLYYIRDNLTLNIINLFYTSDAMNAWQAGSK
jgi:hypothetical protein